MSYDGQRVGIVTTELELKAYKLVKDILCKTIPWCNISYWDTQDYFSIIYDNDANKEICRFTCKETEHILRVYDSNGKPKTYTIPTISEESISKYSDKILESAKRFLKG